LRLVSLSEAPVPAVENLTALDLARLRLDKPHDGYAVTDFPHRLKADIKTHLTPRCSNTPIET
jgi:hypothetical protein